MYQQKFQCISAGISYCSLKLCISDKQPTKSEIQMKDSFSRKIYIKIKEVFLPLALAEAQIPAQKSPISYAPVMLHFFAKSICPGCICHRWSPSPSVAVAKSARYNALVLSPFLFCFGVQTFQGFGYFKGSDYWV